MDMQVYSYYLMTREIDLLVFSVFSSLSVWEEAVFLHPKNVTAWTWRTARRNKTRRNRRIILKSWGNRRAIRFYQLAVCSFFFCFYLCSTNCCLLLVFFALLFKGPLLYLWWSFLGCLCQCRPSVCCAYTCRYFYCCMGGGFLLVNHSTRTNPFIFAVDI